MHMYGSIAHDRSASLLEWPPVAICMHKKKKKIQSQLLNWNLLHGVAEEGHP